MQSLTDKEIMKASDSIDKALASATRENRGETALRIIVVARNLNDHIADKIWKDLRPNEPREIHKVASFFTGVPNYKFIARFNKFLQASVSHFTPSEEGAERLMIKYYRYLLQLKKAMYDRYGIIILRNIDKFLQDLDAQTKDYYRKVASQIEFQLLRQHSPSFDNYYVDKIKPFFVNNEIYYEVVLEPADEKPNKFNRITAFTKCEITTNYCVALSFVDSYIDVFDVHFPIKIITAWQVSIRPCELSNFANLLGESLSVNRGHKEYKALMDFLQQEEISLLDIIDYGNIQYAVAKQRIAATTQKQHSYIFDILDTLMQMGRWFGYRKGYELLQRIWMPTALQEKFVMLEKIDEKLKEELQDYMDKGKSPAQFGPHIVNSATIKRFMITAKNRQQNAVEDDFDFSGDSYETTKFDEKKETLQGNIDVTEAFLQELGTARKSTVSGSAYVWHDVDVGVIKKKFLEAYTISEHSSLFVDIPIFLNWMAEMNKDGRYLKWNVAIAGDKDAETQWTVNDYTVGTIERSRKKDKPCVDIGSLRSGRDAICDVIPESLTPEQKTAFDSTRKNGKNIISARSKFGLEDRPLLLLYRIDKNRGKESKLRCKIGTDVDIIGFSIVVSGESLGGGSHAKTLTVRIPYDG